MCRLSLVIALFLVTFPAFADDLSGLYTAKHMNEVLRTPDKDGKCVPPYYKNENISQCVKEINSTNYLALQKNEDGSLIFNSLIWFYNNHSCSPSGTAEKTETGWRFINTGDQENHYERCEINITIEQNEIVLNALKDSPCRTYCGARGNLSGIRFPLSSRRQVKDLSHCIKHYDYLPICLKADLNWQE